MARTVPTAHRRLIAFMDARDPAGTTRIPDQGDAQEEDVMVTRARKRKLATTTEQLDSVEVLALRQQLAALSLEHTALLDIINAILRANGGRMAIARAYLVGANRRPIALDNYADRFVVRFSDERPDGLVVPGVEGRLHD